jgi:hypothetical protein
LSLIFVFLRFFNERKARAFALSDPGLLISQALSAADSGRMEAAEEGRRAGSPSETRRLLHPLVGQKSFAREKKLPLNAIMYESRARKGKEKVNFYEKMV